MHFYRMHWGPISSPYNAFVVSGNNNEEILGKYNLPGKSDGRTIARAQSALPHANSRLTQLQPENFASAFAVMKKLAAPISAAFAPA